MNEIYIRGNFQIGIICHFFKKLEKLVFLTDNYSNYSIYCYIVGSHINACPRTFAK